MDCSFVMLCQKEHDSKVVDLIKIVWLHSVVSQSITQTSHTSTNTINRFIGLTVDGQGTLGHSVRLHQPVKTSGLFCVPVDLKIPQTHILYFRQHFSRAHGPVESSGDRNQDSTKQPR